MSQDDADPAVRENQALAAQVAAGQAAADVPVGATEVDTVALQRTIEAMQRRVEVLEAERRASAPASPIVGTAQALRTALAEHASGKTTGVPGPTPADADILALGDDLVAAAGNAADSGDGGPVGRIAVKIERWLQRHLLPGDHPFLREIASHLADVKDQADELEPKDTTPPGKVVAGSVVG